MNWTPRGRTRARAGERRSAVGRRLKRQVGSVETPGVKACPHCEAELRDSVIRCTRCGRSLREPVEPDAVPESAPAAAVASARSSPTPTALAEGPRPTGLPDARAFAPASATWDPTPASGPTSALAEVESHRALPQSRRSRGPDLWIMWAGIAAVVAGVLAYLAVADPWVHLTVSLPETDFEEALRVQVTVKGQAAFAGTAAKALAIILAAFGLVWCVFGFHRGWTIPGIANPALAILVTTAGLGLTVVASMVWFVWEDAMVLRAKAAGLTTSAMRELLDRQPTPLVEIERLWGMMSFGGMMLLGLGASCLGWWAYRRRG